MRLRVSFKLSGDSAELARRISEYSKVEIDDLAEMAFLSYLEHVVRATEKKIKETRGDVQKPTSNFGGIGSDERLTLHSKEGGKSSAMDDSQG